MNDLDIKKIRKSLGLTQAEMARRIGVDTKTVQNWEYGKTIPISKHGIIRSLMVEPQTYYGGEVDQSNVNGDNIQGNHVTVNKYVEELMERLKSRDEALMKAQEQMSKAQEQMDRLLAIIDNLTRQH